MSRRVIAWLSCLALLASGILTATATAGAQGECRYTDAETAAIKAAKTRLQNAGIVQGVIDVPPRVPVSLDPDVTRAEFAALVVRGMGREDDAKRLKGESVFADTRDHWAAGYIALLHQEGIAKGYPGGHYSPDEYISLVQAKIMLARLLRVHVGNTPAEIDSALQHAGVDVAIPCDNDGMATRDQVFLLLDRALSVPFYTRLQNQ